MTNDTEIRAAIKKLRKRLNRVEKRLSALEKGSGLKPVSGRRKPSTTLLLERLKQEGFFDTLRTSVEIRDRLAAISHHRTRTSLTNPLARAAAKGLLTRIKVNRVWRYTRKA